MKKTVLILLILLPSLLIGQTHSVSKSRTEHQINGLKKKLNLKKLTTKDLDVIIEIRKHYVYVNLDSALYYSNIEVSLAEKVENPNTLAVALIRKASLLWKLQQPDLAHKLLLENIRNKSVIADSTYAKTLYIIAKVEIQKQMPAESIQHVIEASKFYTAQNDSINASSCFSHIAGIYTFVLQEPEKSIPYFEKSLDFNSVRDPQNAIRSYINYSSALLGMSKTEEAIKKIRKAKLMAESSNNAFFLPSIYVQFANIYNETGSFQKSLKYALLADSLIKDVPGFDRGTQQKIYWYLALNYKALENYDKAINYFRMLEGSHYIDPTEIQSNMIEIYKEQGDFEQAFFLQEELIAAKDSSDILARNEQLLDVVEKYENEKKQQEIIALNAEKELQNSEIRTQRFILYGTIGFFVILIIIGAFWYKTRTKLRETTLSLETTRLQQQFLRTQLNPHFFFHALTSIETYIYKNDKLKSAGFLRDFSILMRNILEFSDVDFISLRQDIDFIKKYIELQQLNHEFKFNYEINVSSELNIDEISIPPMLIQPAVENAILHGALNTENGVVSIEYTKIGDQFQILIKDNGEARKENKPSSNRLNRSMSLDITQTRIKNFQEVHGVTILYRSFDSIKNDGDSSVSFSMPLKF